MRFDPAVLRFDRAALGALAVSAGASEPAPKVDALHGRVELPLAFVKPEAVTHGGAVVELTFTVHTGRATTQLIAAQTEAVAGDGAGRLMLPGPRSLSLRIVR